MKKIIRLTESDLKRLIERVVKEQDEEMYNITVAIQKFLNNRYKNDKTFKPLRVDGKTGSNSQTEMAIKKYQKDATIITGVLYNNNKTTCKYLPNSRIKIPIAYYKIVVLPKKTICYISNNDDKDKVNITTLSSILKLAKKNKNNLKITIK